MRKLAPAPGSGCGSNEEMPPAGAAPVPARTWCWRNSPVRRGGGSTAVAVLLGCGLTAGCGAGEEEAPPRVEAEVVTLAADSASNPTVALDRRSGTAYVSWVGREAGENAVFVAAISPDGQRSDPVRANDIAGDVAPHLQAPAQVAVGPGGTVYVLWQNNTPIEGRRFPASDLRLAVSDDGGRSFRPAITVNDDAGGPPTSHTFHDIAVAGDGTVVVSWIDSRTRDAVAHQRVPAGPMHDEGMSHHDHGAGTVAASHDHAASSLPEGPEIRVARSVDEGRSFGVSMVVDSAACPCCRTSIALAGEGSVYVAWRKIFPGDIRDIVVARAAPDSAEFSEPVRVHADDWVFPGCPHAGPSLAVDAEDRLMVGWYTGKEGRQGLWYAASEDGGRSFGKPTAVLTGDWVPPSQVRLATAGDRVWAVWEDRTDEGPRVRAAAGAVGGALTPVAGWEVSGSDPAIVASPDGARVAWLRDFSVLSFQF